MPLRFIYQLNKKKYKKKVSKTEYKWQNLNFILKYEQKTTIEFTAYTYWDFHFCQESITGPSEVPLY